MLSLHVTFFFKMQVYWITLRRAVKRPNMSPRKLKKKKFTCLQSWVIFTFHMYRKKLGVVFGCLEMLKAMNRHTDTLRVSCRSVHKCVQFPTWSHILVLIPPFRHKQMVAFFVMVHSDHQCCWTTVASLNIPSSECMGHWGCHTVYISVLNHVSWSHWDWGLHLVPAETVAFKRCCWCWHTWNLWLQETETLSWICSRGKYIPWNAVFNTECISVSCQCRLDFIFIFCVPDQTH